jgi:hypothetical protein
MREQIKRDDPPSLVETYVEKLGKGEGRLGCEVHLDRHPASPLTKDDIRFAMQR